MFSKSGFAFTDEWIEAGKRFRKQLKDATW